MKYSELVKEVHNRAGLDDLAEANRAIEATLETLGDRLAGNEPIDLGAQLPPPLRELIARPAGLAEKYGRDEFLRRVAERTGTSFHEASHLARSVLRAIAAFVGEDEMSELRSKLPDDYASLLEHARPRALPSR